MRLWEDTPVEASCKIIVLRLKLTGPLRSSIPGTFLGLLLTLRKDQFYGDNKMLFVSMFLQRSKKVQHLPRWQIDGGFFCLMTKENYKTLDMSYSWGFTDDPSVKLWAGRPSSALGMRTGGRRTKVELLRLKVERTYPLGFEPDKNSPSYIAIISKLYSSKLLLLLINLYILQFATFTSKTSQILQSFIHELPGNSKVCLSP